MHDQVDIEKALVIHDKEDGVVPFAAAERIAAAWPNATFIVTEGYGHFDMVKERKYWNMWRSLCEAKCSLVWFYFGFAKTIFFSTMNAMVRKGGLFICPCLPLRSFALLCG